MPNKKTNPKRKKIKKDSFGFVNIFKALILLLFLAYVFSAVFTKNFVEKDIKSNIFNVYKAETQTPSPTSSPTPTPKKEVFTGFCLSVPVLFYHHIAPMDVAKKEGHAQLTVDIKQFENQMKYLNDRGYTTISAEDLVVALINKQSILGKPIVVSTDDGYSDNYTYAFSVIKQYNIRTSFFIPTGLIGNSGYMTWGNLSDMASSGIVHIYNHTWSHYSLGRGDFAKSEFEISTAQKQIEQYLGKKPTVFAYPFGSSSEVAIDVLKENGILGAFTTIPSFIQCDSFIYRLHRIRVGNSSLSSYGL